jgi:phenylacetate-coenzyme A ligase PaaK-like adenylate-forming protein
MRWSSKARSSSECQIRCRFLDERLPELRVATSIARSWGEQGRRADARVLLTPVYGWFTEGFGTAGLKDAAKLPCELT